MVHDFNVGIVMVNSDIRSVFVKKKVCKKYYCMMVIKWECIKMACILLFVKL